METFPLTPTQQAIFDRIEDRAKSPNILIQGPGGVGKSVLINNLVENGRKPYTLAAPTGLAALNIGGRTLHSIFRLPVSEGIIEHDYNRFPTDDRVVNNIRYNVSAIIIDEVSMVRADMFDYIDRMLKAIKGNSAPFGGVQMILVGDFYQLPPIVKGVEKKALMAAGFDSEFIFSSPAYKAGNFEVIELTEVLRQKDPVFKKVLDAARVGYVGAKDLALLNKQVGFVDDMRIRLCGANKQAEEINYAFLHKLPTDGKREFTASMFGEWKDYPVPVELELRIGAQVMVKVNGADRPQGVKGEHKSLVVNGTVGEVTAIYDNRVDLTLSNGEEVTIYRRSWEKKVKRKNGDEWEEIVVASYEQIPLALAWAISIHKSQGMSFDRVHVDLSRIFSPGQSYVALSRCRSIAGLSLETPIAAHKFFANKDVIKFFEDAA